jgi:hypothetical protein
MSKRYKLNRTDLKSLAKSVALAVVGFVLAYILSDVLPNVDLGKNAWLVPVVTVLVNAAQKWVSGQK